jgi:hypothetical protein
MEAYWGKRLARIHVFSVLLMVLCAVSLSPRRLQRRSSARLSSGKFVPLENALQQSAFPVSVIVAQGDEKLSMTALETLDDILFAATGNSEVPVVILADESRGLTLRKLLTSNELQRRDHVIPKGEGVVAPGPSCLIFSGLPRESCRAAMQGIKEWNPPSTGKVFPSAIAFAVVVPAALDKPFSQLVREIQGDYKENLPGNKSQ